MSDNTETSETQTPAQEIDWKAEARKWESRAKDNKSALDALQAQFDQETARVSDLESKNTELTEKVTGFEEEKALAELVSKVAEAKGVPASALRGRTEDELNAHADALKTLLDPSAPVIEGQAKSPNETPADPAREAVRGLFNANP